MVRTMPMFPVVAGEGKILFLREVICYFWDKIFELISNDLLLTQNIG